MAMVLPDEPLAGHLDVRRMCCISLSRPTDHAGDVLVVPDEEFDIEQTIFRTMEIPKVKKQMAKDMGIKVFWRDAAVAKAVSTFSKVPAALPHDSGLMNFLRTECEFNVEHADGSFMDHLRFCYEYSAKNFAAHSPRALFLHSILGTGTNVFPMELQKLSQLASMLTPEEMVHIESFPSILRLLHTFKLQEALEANRGRLGQLEAVTFHRVIDNKRIHISAEDLWVQLNYQLIHELDFLPLANWSDRISSGNLQSLQSVHELLSRAGKLEARVDLDVACHSQDGTTRTVADAMALHRAAIKKDRDGMVWFHKYFSQKIGHDLDFELIFAPHPKL